MSAVITDVRGKAGLVFGLQWAPLHSKEKADAELREFARLNDARRVIRVTSDQGWSQMAAYTADPVSEEANKGVRQLHSGAVLFGRFLASRGHSEGVFLYRDELWQNESVLVRIINGVPTIDLFDKRAKVTDLAQGQMQAAGVQGWTNDLEALPSAELLNLEELWGFAESGSKSGTLLSSAPADIKGLLLLGIAAAVLVGGGIGWKQYSAYQQRKAAEEAARKADPTPQYLEALESSKGQVGWTGSQARSIIAQAYQQPLYLRGWVLRSIICTSDSMSCSMAWARLAGTTEDLLAAREPFGEKPAAGATLGQIDLIGPASVQRQGFSGREGLPALDQWGSSSTSLLQLWQSAGLDPSMSAEGFKVWPSVAGVDTSSLSPDITVKASGLDLTGPGVLVDQALAASPSNAFWSEIKVTPDVGGGDPMNVLKISVKGNVYVR